MIKVNCKRIEEFQSDHDEDDGEIVEEIEEEEEEESH